MWQIIIYISVWTSIFILAVILTIFKIILSSSLLQDSFIFGKLSRILNEAFCSICGPSVFLFQFPCSGGILHWLSLFRIFAFVPISSTQPEYITFLYHPSQRIEWYKFRACGLNKVFALKFPKVYQVCYLHPPTSHALYSPIIFPNVPQTFHRLFRFLIHCFK